MMGRCYQPIQLINPSNHSSVKLIRYNTALSDMFQCETVSLDAILKDITYLNSAKNNPFKTIPNRCLKEFADICNSILIPIWNKEITRNLSLQI